MNVWLSLWRKEARDQSMLLLVSSALFATLLVGARLVVGASFDGPLRLGYVHPTALLVVAVALAAEALTRDAQSGVERTLLRLSVSRTALWSAKASFVVAALIAFACFETVCERVLGLWESATTDRGDWDCLLGSALPVVLAVASVLAASSLVRRTLAAALLGVGLPLALAWLVHAAPDGVVRDWIFRVVAVSTPAVVVGALTVALAVGSVAGYGVTRFDPLGLRRGAAIALGFALALAAPLGWTVAHGCSALNPTSSSHTFDSWRALPSPDGRFVALEVQRSRNSMLEWGSWLAEGDSDDAQSSRREVWILDRTTGVIDELDDRWRVAWTAHDWCREAPAWTADGCLVTVASDRFFGDEEPRGELLDPATGAVVGSFVPSADDLGPAVAPEPWYRVRRRGGSREVAFADGSHATVVGAGDLLAVSPERGVYFVERAGAILRARLGSSDVTQLGMLEGERIGRTRVSPDGRWLAWRDGKLLSIVDSRTGAKVFGPSSEIFVDWSTHGRIATVSNGAGSVVIELDGSRRALDGGWPVECGADGWLTRMPDRLTWRSDDGARTEVLYTTR